MTRGDVVWSYSGVRPLFDDHASAAQEATRDYVLRLDQPEGAAGLLDVFGGKLTTHRRLSEEAVELIEKVLGRPRPGMDEDRPAARRGFRAHRFFRRGVAARRALSPACRPS